jgi:hypothetical protein
MKMELEVTRNPGDGWCVRVAAQGILPAIEHRGDYEEPDVLVVRAFYHRLRDVASLVTPEAAEGEAYARRAVQTERNRALRRVQSLRDQLSEGGMLGNLDQSVLKALEGLVKDGF